MTNRGTTAVRSARVDEASRSIAEGEMDEHEAYLFDLQGFLALEGALSWSATWYDADRYPELTDRQRAILEPPNARYRGRRVGTRPGAVS